MKRRDAENAEEHLAKKYLSLHLSAISAPQR